MAEDTAHPKPSAAVLPGAAEAHLPRTFGLAWLLAFTGAATPGPMLALVIGQVLAQGFLSVLPILLGHALLEAVLIGGFAFGLAHRLKGRRVRGFLSLVGGLALAWMGMDIVLHARQMTLAAAESQALGWPMLILAGIGVSLSNPYFTGWWATVGAGQIATFGLRRIPEYLTFWIGHEMGDAVWYVFIAALLSLGRRLLNDDVYQGLLLVCGSVILLLAVVFLVMGTRCLFAAGQPAPASSS
ncbi:MAG: LysE family transporter [Lentisphaerae bacterium]|jgi:threonine/homoserine/homoserine lactone efflux protein|nr:LysE family transporter [Lentisphaerota bacterium]MBT4822385.1 LysE family transporter [Lentisphaerota bacterium]MBT5611362.1 LysE family transporter [Lentisphaerota bacterium]MBT7061543.1 LysE family transporter [Lentisphaerota bacterium]MBT7842267.1 LysE family transporter [Lentisphaerota bacterium]